MNTFYPDHRMDVDLLSFDTDNPYYPEVLVKFPRKNFAPRRTTMKNPTKKQTNSKRKRGRPRKSEQWKGGSICYHLFLPMFEVFLFKDKCDNFPWLWRSAFCTPFFAFRAEKIEWFLGRLGVRNLWAQASLKRNSSNALQRPQDAPSQVLRVWVVKWAQWGLRTIPGAFVSIFDFCWCYKIKWKSTFDSITSRKTGHLML